MEKKNSFLVGLTLSLLIFFALYALLSLITSRPMFVKDPDSLWIYIVSLIPNVILARFMLVKWDLEQTGKGMLLVGLLGIIVVMFLMLK